MNFQLLHDEKKATPTTIAQNNYSVYITGFELFYSRRD